MRTAASRFASRRHAPLVFRAGGTSLNGQTQTDSILVDVRRHWQRARVEDGGRPGPGPARGSLGHANRLLARHGRALGPDPASTNIACVGGVVANNSGGMRCGSHRRLLPDGALDDARARQRHGDRHRGARTPRSGSRDAAPELAAGLVQIRDELRGDPELTERVARKFEIKNTTGYRLCAFLDAETPARDLPPAGDRLGGDARVCGRGGVRDGARSAATRRWRWSRFEDLRQRRRGRRLAGRGRRDSDRADGRSNADRRRLQHARHARRSGRSFRSTSAALLIEFRADDATRSTSSRRAALEILAQPARVERARLSARSRGDRDAVARPGGHAGAAGAMRPPGVHADHRGRVRAAGPGRGGGQGPPGAARQARLPARASPATPRPATCTSC